MESTRKRIASWRQPCFWGLLVLVLGGVVIIVIGVALFVTPTDRERRVNAYNDAVDAYEAGSMRALALNWTGRVNGATIAIQQQSVPYVGDDSDIRKAVSIVAVAFVDPGVGTFVWDISPNFPRFTSAFTLTGNSLYNIYCDRQSCTTDCNSEHYKCSSAAVAATCKSLFGAQTAYLGTNCESGSWCGECLYGMYLSTQCYVAHLSPKTQTWGIEANQSCFTPFTSTPTLQLSLGLAGLYTSVQPVSVSSILRTSDDPLLVLRAMTGGSMDFGPPEFKSLSRRGYATIMLAVGGIVCVGGGALLIWFTCCRAPSVVLQVDDEGEPLPALQPSVSDETPAEISIPLPPSDHVATTAATASRATVVAV